MFIISCVPQDFIPATKFIITYLQSAVVNLFFILQISLSICYVSGNLILLIFSNLIIIVITSNGITIIKVTFSSFL